MLAQNGGQDDPESIIQVMFRDKGWDSATLKEILKRNQYNVQAAADEILAAGSPQNWIIQRMGAPAAPRPMVNLPKATKFKFVTVVVPEGVAPSRMLKIHDAGRSFVIKVPDGLKTGKHFRAKIPDYSDIPGSEHTVQGQEIGNPLMATT